MSWRRRKGGANSLGGPIETELNENKAQPDQTTSYDPLAPSCQRRPELRGPFASSPAELPYRFGSDGSIAQARSTHIGSIFRDPFKSRRDTVAASLSLSSQTARSPRPEDLGLHLVQNTPTPAADLVLVHGLGGSWLKTWSWKRDPELFWPQWLATDATLSGLRVFSYGYNADFRGPGVSTSILDFSRDLLFKMHGWFAEGEQRIGQLPIIFVAHSMGGLVVKESYIIGMMDKNYTSMISRVFGVVFLSTPHKGSMFASTLNNILAVSMVASSKIYLSELESQSPTLQHINEKFRLVCKDLRLVSFYETLKTSVGGAKKLIVDKDSGILGYPSEVSSSMVADHHTVCKYNGPDDPNFVALKDTLRDWLFQSNPYGNTPVPHLPESVTDHVSTLSEILGIYDMPENGGRQAMNGTCQWVFTKDYFDRWRQPDSPSSCRTLWITGVPGTGKSTLAQSILGSMKNTDDEQSSLCQHHSFSSTDLSGRSVAFALRSIAFQLAMENGMFCSQLLQLHQRSGVGFDQLDTHVIWTKIFEGIIFKLDFPYPLYWIVDALDECDAPVAFSNMLLHLRSRSPIKAFLTSRPTRDLISIATSRRPSLQHVPLSESDTDGDIQLFIRNGIEERLPIEDDLKAHVTQQMFRKASGSFLWAKLALDTLERNWYTVEDIHRAINGVPEGMQPLFEQMLQSISSLRQESERNYTIAFRILTWATCAAEPMTIQELAEALRPEFGQFTNLGVTVLHLCGQFLTTNAQHISLIHETARSFLLDSQRNGAQFLNRLRSHEHLARVCIAYLCDEKLKQTLLRLRDSESSPKSTSSSRLAALVPEQPFLKYAVLHWAYHASHADVDSSELARQVEAFFDRHVLTWIHACVVMRGLHVVTRAAQQVKAYVRRRRSKSSCASPVSLSHDHDAFLRQWAGDLIRVVARFSGSLAGKPASIYKVIPPLCPSGSRIFKTYATAGGLEMKGLSSDTWDDCLARLPISGENAVSKVLSTDAYFACLVAVNGTVVVCYSETCEEVRRMTHGEYVTSMAINKSGSLLATAGFNTFRIWELSSGEEVYRITKPRKHPRVMTLSFGPVDNEVLVAYDDCVVDCYDMSSGETLWAFLTEDAHQRDSLHCPREMAFSPDITKIAVAFRGKPALVWSLNTTGQRETPRQLIRGGDRLKKASDIYFPAETIKWESDSSSLFVLYQDTVITRFFLGNTEEDEDEPLECHTTSAREIAVSHDGNLLLTSDISGTLSLWTLPKFHLVYSLPYEQFVRDLAFSSDSQRIYDVRGTTLNVWEPDVLIRAEEDHDNDDTSSMGDGSSTIFSELVVSADNTARSQITALMCGPSLMGDEYYACGKADGSVTIHEAGEGKRIRKVLNHQEGAGVTALAWCPTTGRYIASCDDWGTVIVKRLELKRVDTAQGPSSRWAVFPCLEIKIDGSVNQLLFSPSARFCLAASSESDCAWDVKIKAEIWRRDKKVNEGQWWTTHPTDPDSVICIDPESAEMLVWSELSKGRNTRGTVGTLPVGESAELASAMAAMANDEARPRRVRHLTTIPERKYVVCETAPVALSDLTRVSGTEIRLELLVPGESRPRSVPALDYLSRSVRRFLGCYRDHAVFLNHEFWVCTWPIASFSPAAEGQSSGKGKETARGVGLRAGPETLGLPAIKRHFFLPRDCIAPSMLPLIRLADSGTILFPKNGEVAIIRNGLKL